MTFATYSVLQAKTIPDDLDSSIYTAIPIARNDGKKGKSGLAMVVDALSENSLQRILLSDAGKKWIADSLNTIRGRLASAQLATGGTVSREIVGTGAIIAAMVAEAESQRISKESIGNWFDSDLAGLVAEKVLAKLPTLAEDKVEEVVKAYRTKFQVLAAQEPSMDADTKAALLSVLDLLPEDYSSVIGDKIMARMNKVDTSSLLMKL